MDEPQFVELADGVHAMLSPELMSNCTLVVSDDGVLVVDAPYTRALAEAVQAYTRRLSPQPIRWVVSSHHHGDHILHLGAFTPPAIVLGHARNRENIATYGESERAHFSRQRPAQAAEYATVPIVLPSVTYTDVLTLYLGDREVRLWHPGPAHTTGDTVLFLPAERLAVVADLLFSGVFPIARSADLGGWIAALDALQAMPLDTVVPGHGPISTRRELASMRVYLAAVRDAVLPYARDGLPLNRALAEIRLDQYAAWANPERLVQAIERAYAELSR
ncbi:MAG TPA: MBL fold metallo-hydrolase [Chloroflexota bacterium]|jgi:cyclase